jgi:protein-S-isoprenylcysteine O-methyltransferase
VLRWYAIRVLGKFFTFDVAIAKGQTVVEAGPYRWIRHPSYTGSLIGFLGLGLTFTNWAALLVPMLCMIGAYAYRIPIEERALCKGLGQPYVDYMQRTWRLIPRIY